MSVLEYTISLLTFEDCRVKKTPLELIEMLKAWRKSHNFATKCNICKKELNFGEASFTMCCQVFYYDGRSSTYSVNFIGIKTDGFTFLLPQLKRKLKDCSSQQFLVLPDPIYWQVTATLQYEKVMKFVLKLPVTNRTTNILPVSKTDTFYDQIQKEPLNYGSLQKRSCGKSTLIRQVAYGKRCILSMRGMIVPDASLKPNQIRLPDKICKEFNIQNQWVILNRMPSLHPANFVALQVFPWSYECFGIPMEIVQAMNADFDGDECNVYLVPNVQSQAECMTLLNTEAEMGCFVMGLKLAPCQDLLAAYYIFYDEIDFLPYKSRNLVGTMQVIYDLYGSGEAFRCFDRLRQFYLDVFQRRKCFALTLAEMESLYQCGQNSNNQKEFEEKILESCLVIQVKSGAKGSVEHLYQMFKAVGWQNDVYIHNSFWHGLSPTEFVTHALVANEALQQSGKIWEPGYGYSKSVYNLQGLHVNYLGQLVDGTIVIEEDVLYTLNHTDVMSEEAFHHLLNNTMIQNKIPNSKV